MKNARRSVAIAVAAMIGHSAVAQEQCLTPTELDNVARMSTVMGLGGALRRCGSCLGNRYQPTVDKYEATDMLVEFRRAEAAVHGSPSKFEYADDLVRITARKYAGDLSADCAACDDTAKLVDELGSQGEQATLYGTVAERISKLPSYKKCP